MKILIIEDESRIAKRITRMVISFFKNKLESIHKCESIEEGLTYLTYNQIDLLLLDLNLNGEDGFDILESVLSQSFHTIIISAYTDRAIQAFEYGVLDFVPKPFDEQRLIQALIRAEEKTKDEDLGEMRFLAIKKAGSVSMIPLEELSYIKGAGIYSELNLLNGRQELHDKSLDKLAQLLPPHFQRIHKSYIASLLSIERITIGAGGKYAVLLKDGSVLPVGRSRYRELKESLI